ncbi:Transposase Tc1-like, partial [Trinorchestia longiramus]
VSRQTVSRRLHEIGLYARSPRKKTLISKKNQTARLAFAKKHVVWSEGDWQKVFFSDESKFNVIGSDGKQFVRRRIGESLNSNCIKKTVKFGGGSVMVFGMISGQGTSPLVRLNTKVSAAVDKNVLQQYVVPVLQNSGFQNPIFMQDNAPCHNAKVV